jgi:hypothetical protein
MEWVEERKTTFCDEVKQDNIPEASENGSHKRNSSMSQYLQNEKDEVIFGGYTPSVTDGTKLSQRFSEVRPLLHPKEDIFQNGVKTLPICIGLLSVDNILPPTSFFNQVN